MEIALFLYKWLRVSILTLLIVIGFSAFLRYTRFKHLIVKVLGVYMITNAWLVLYMCYLIDGHYSFYYALPLHVCSLTIVCCGVSVFYKSQFFLEMIYYFGIIGATLALMLPIFVYERSGYLFWDYFIGHGLILVIIAYHLSNNFIPRKNSAIKCYGVFLVLAVVISIFNIYFGMNYWYISENPGFRTGLYSSIWPYYILEWFGVGIVFLFLLERPFKKYH